MDCSYLLSQLDTMMFWVEAFVDEFNYRKLSSLSKRKETIARMLEERDSEECDVASLQNCGE